MAGVDALKLNRMVASSMALTPFSSLFSLKSTLESASMLVAILFLVWHRSNTAATSVTTVPLSVCYRALNLLVRVDTSNFVSYACDAEEYEGLESTAPLSAISSGSMAAEWSYRTLETPAPVFPFLGSPSTGALCLLYFLSFYNCPDSLFLMPLVLSQVPSFVPQEKSARCWGLTLALLQTTWPFIGLTRLEQTFHWLISISRDFWSPKASFPIHLLLSLLFKHLDKGSLVPPMCTHGGSSFPQIITLFTQVRRVFRSLFRILVPRSGSSLLVPDVTYRFITIALIPV